jgi:hypothetical protein
VWLNCTETDAGDSPGLQNFGSILLRPSYYGVIWILQATNSFGYLCLAISILSGHDGNGS